MSRDSLISARINVRFLFTIYLSLVYSMQCTGCLQKCREQIYQVQK